MEKVEDIKRPLKVGEFYLVPCIVTEYPQEVEVYDDWNDLKIYKRKKFNVNPIINHSHSDKENGQIEKHYHIDYRFLIHKNGLIQNKDSRYTFGGNGRPKGDSKIEYIRMEVRDSNFYDGGITPVSLISKSKLKHKCIHKGKCPHRGFDLSQVPPSDGVITCPLHGLKFNEETKELITK